MKNMIACSLLLALCLLFSCQKESNLKPVSAGGSSSLGGSGGGGKVVTPPVLISPWPPTDTVSSKAPIGTLITTGTWKVTSYIELTSNGTDKFSTYTFTFDASGKITANQNGKLFTGTWVYLNAVFYYGVPVYGSSPDGFNIHMGTTKPLSLLGKNLFISKKTTTNFFLSSVNPAEDTHITFTKIAN